jgi:hypothetical protein
MVDTRMADERSREILGSLLHPHVRENRDDRLLTARVTERYAHAAPGHLLAAVQRISGTPASSVTDTGTDTSARQSV